MKQVRITPISLIMAAMITWVLWEVIDGDFLTSQLVYLIPLFIILVAADQIARVAIKDLRRVWIIELVFAAAVFAVAWIVRIWMM